MLKKPRRKAIFSNDKGNIAMRTLVCLFLLITAYTANLLKADESNVVVKVSLETTSQTRTAQELLDGKAKEAAVRKYLKTHDASLPETIVEQCCSEASKFIEDIELEGTYKWLQLSTELWQLSGEYAVEIKADEVNKFLKVQGAGVQGNLEIVILEDPLH